MATYNKEDIKHQKKKEVKDTTVDDVIIDEKIVLLREFFSALDETATKTEDWVARNQKLLLV
jgi:hypothetical protein